jgi:hypothetical protein
MGFTASEISAALGPKGLRGCPMCGQSGFTAADGVVALSVSPDTSSLQIGGPSVPAVLMACNHCGFLSMHSANVLGLT